MSDKKQIILSAIDNHLPSMRSGGYDFIWIPLPPDEDYVRLGLQITREELIFPVSGGKVYIRMLYDRQRLVAWIDFFIDHITRIEFAVNEVYMDDLEIVL